MCELFLLDSDSEGPKVQIHLHMNDCMRNNFGYLVVSAPREHPQGWSVGTNPCGQNIWSVDIFSFI